MQVSPLEAEELCIGFALHEAQIYLTSCGEVFVSASTTIIIQAMWCIPGFPFSPYFHNKLCAQRKKGKSRLKLGDRQEKKMEAHGWRQDMSVLDCKSKLLRDLRRGRVIHEVLERLFWCWENKKQTRGPDEVISSDTVAAHKGFWFFGASSTASGHQEENPENRTCGSEAVAGKGISMSTAVK